MFLSFFLIYSGFLLESLLWPSPSFCVSIILFLSYVSSVHIPSHNSPLHKILKIPLSGLLGQVASDKFSLSKILSKSFLHQSFFIYASFYSPFISHFSLPMILFIGHLYLSSFQLLSFGKFLAVG